MKQHRSRSPVPCYAIIEDECKICVQIGKGRDKYRATQPERRQETKRTPILPHLKSVCKFCERFVFYLKIYTFAVVLPLGKGVFL